MFFDIISLDHMFFDIVFQDEHLFFDIAQRLSESAVEAPISLRPTSLDYYDTIQFMQGNFCSYVYSYLGPSG